MTILWEPQDILTGKIENLGDSFNKNPKIFAEKILKSNAVSASITMPIQMLSNDGNAVLSKTITIPFYMKDDFSVGSISNNWEDLVDMNFANDFTKLLNVGSFFAGGAQITMQSEAMSLKSWKGSSYDGFSVNCLFLATNRAINPTKIIRTLAASALPTKLKGDNTTLGENVKTSFKNIVSTGSDLIASGIRGFSEKAADMVTQGTQTANRFIDDLGMVAPLHYGIKVEMDNTDGIPTGPIPNTTLTLQVGEYFCASELLVKSIGNITFSKEIIAPKPDFTQKGTDLYNPDSNETNHSFPLWGSCTVSFIPCSMMTKDKFEGYFKDPYDSNPNSWKQALIDKIGLQYPNTLKENIDKVTDTVRNFFNLP